MNAPSAGHREELLAILRCHWIVLWREAIAVAFFAFTPIVLLDSLIRYGFFPAGNIMFSLALIFSLVWLLVAWIGYALIWTRRQLSVWLVSTLRIIRVHYSGFMSRIIIAWPLDRVGEVIVGNVGFLQSFFRYGSIALTLKGEEGEFIVMEDISHPELVQAVIVKQQSRYAALELKNQEQEDVIQFVSHATKGYLSKNKAAFASIVEGDYGEVSRELHSMAGSALKDTQHGVETVISILEGDRREPFDFATIVAEEVESMRFDAERKGLTVEFQMPAERYIVSGDEAKVRGEVVRNLLDNAVRYTPSGKIEVELLKKDGAVCLAVRDTGIGITSEDMSILFTKGGHGRESRKVNPESTGFGLAAAKRVVDALGGRIWAESKGTGQGSQFYVDLPILKS